MEDIGTIDMPLNEEEIEDDGDAWPQIDGIQKWLFVHGWLRQLVYKKVGIMI